MNLASTEPPLPTMTEVRSSTNCDGTQMRSSPPFCPPQPPDSVRWSSPPARAAPKNARARKSARAVARSRLA